LDRSGARDRGRIGNIVKVGKLKVEIAGCGGLIDLLLLRLR
jgi:hypothetical protein